MMLRALLLAGCAVAAAFVHRPSPAWSEGAMGMARSAEPKCDAKCDMPKAHGIVPLSAGDVAALSKTVYFEARGEPDAFCAMAAVAWTVINRMTSDPETFGGTIQAVVYKKWQYSVWNGGRNRPIPESDPSWLLARFAALSVLTGSVPDMTKGSTHFINSSIRPPEWTNAMTMVLKLGRHRFYRDAD
jgi:spore germination cell wall hydrolase CwlJ-like protein